MALVVAGGLGVLRVWPPFAVVMSGSMAPTINTGDLVVLQRLHAPARVGQVVTVPVPDDARARYGYPPVVIHRVVQIAAGQIRTKGDARPTADPFTVPRSAVDARVIADIPAGGRVLAFFHSAPGLLWLLFGGVLFFGLPLLDRARDARRRDGEATDELREQVVSVSAELVQLRAERERSRETATETLSQVDRLTQLLECALAVDAATPAGGGLAQAPAGSEVPARMSVVPGDGITACDAGSDVHGAVAHHASADGALGCAVAPSTDGDREGAPSPDVAETSAGVIIATAAHEPDADAVSAAPAPGSPPACSFMETGANDVRCAADYPLVAAHGGVATAEPIAVSWPAGRPAPPDQRWDAPPPATSASDAGWAAPPSVTASGRFRREGRLIAASLARLPASA